MKSNLLAAIALLILADSVRSDSGQPRLRTQTKQIMREPDLQFSMPVKKWEALVGITKAGLLRKVGTPVQISNNRNGKETWTYGRHYSIVFNRGIAVDAFAEFQTGVFELGDPAEVLEGTFEKYRPRP